MGIIDEPHPAHTSVKESVFPFSKFPGVDVILGPEMRSTGEVMGIDMAYPIAFAKAQKSAGTTLPTSGHVLLTVRDTDKPAIVAIAQQLIEMGFTLVTTGGTHDYLAKHDIDSQRINKIQEGRPNCIDVIKNHEAALIINTPTRKGINTDEGRIRALAVRFNVPIITTCAGGLAAVQAIGAIKTGQWGVKALQDYFSAALSTTA